MSMEPFDYLTYKRNKQQKLKDSEDVKKDKKIVVWVCGGTFVVFFLAFMFFVGSKSSKVDIEYSNNHHMEASNKMDEEDFEEVKQERYTIDKRLFVIQQEERRPSESKVVAPIEANDVISKDEFDMIKTNNIETNKKLQDAQKPSQSEDAKANLNTSAQTAQTSPAKVAIKPKLPVKPEATPISAISAQTVSSKVLVGKYQTVDEARKVQMQLSGSVSGAAPFIKKINSYYSVQIGSFESFDTAKSVAGKLMSKGFDVWILQ